MPRLLLIAAAAMTMTATSATAVPCKDAKGKFIKCPPAKPAPATRCKLNGKFARCGTPGAKPV